MPLFLKTFYFNWQDFNGNKFENLLGVWQQHIDNLPIGLIGYFFSCLIMLGIIVTIVKKKKQWLPFLPIGLLALLMLLQATWPINFIFSWLRDQNEIFKEGLRFPFTKFSLLLMMFASLYLVVALQFFRSTSS